MRIPLLFVLLIACGGQHQHQHQHQHHTGHHRFQDAEHWAKEFDDPTRDEWQRPKDVVAAMSITPGMFVADIGAGTGYFEPHLARAVGENGKVFALDVEPNMISYMTKRFERDGVKNVKPIQIQEDGPKLDEQVDRFLIVDTWHHIDSREAYVAKLKSALKPGGKVFIVDFKLDAKLGPPPKHRIPPEQTMKELEAGGLKAERVALDLPEQYVVAGAL